MTDTKPAAAKPGQLKETERITQGPGPGSRPDGRRHGRSEGQPLQAVRQAAGRRSSRRERPKVVLVLLLAVVSVALMSIGPRILGRATDLIFAGVLGKQHPRRA